MDTEKLSVVLKHYGKSVLFQPKDQLPLHMACARTSGAVTVVQYLLKSAGKETRLNTDKVCSLFILNLFTWKSINVLLLYKK